MGRCGEDSISVSLGPLYDFSRQLRNRQAYGKGICAMKMTSHGA
jgi:hypothetical protein